MNLTGDSNTPAIPMSEAEVNHLRRLLAWLRCEYTLDADMQRGYLTGVSEAVRLGMASEERASELVAGVASRINQCPAYVRQAVKMLTKALREHERNAGIVEAPK
jgi:alkylhydroperoxidase family enzyme